MNLWNTTPENNIRHVNFPVFHIQHEWSDQQLKSDLISRRWDQTRRLQWPNYCNRKANHHSRKRCVLKSSSTNKATTKIKFTSLNDTAWKTTAQSVKWSATKWTARSTLEISVFTIMIVQRVGTQTLAQERKTNKCETGCSTTWYCSVSVSLYT